MDNNRPKSKEGEEPVASKISVKKPEDIKSFAESTMNELLGWYGYDSPKQEPKTSKNSRSNDSENEFDGCGWCGKPVDENNKVVSATATFCSELCFSQSRRASFKRNKTCDWCRHAHHTVSYVELQDNSSQLQFCSDSCLNQYKMHIFCRETRAHLELHPHIHQDSAESSGNLITPDLWMKNCVSPPQTPPTPPKIEPLPLITVAPPSKLLGNDKRNRSRQARRFVRRGGCSSTITSSLNSEGVSSDEVPQDLRIRQSPPPAVVEGESPKDPGESRLSPKLSSPNIRAILNTILPPPTTFVPYPVILPLPIPIPIPIPIPKMFKTNTGKDLVELKDCEVQTDDLLSLNNNNSDFDLDKEVQSSQTRLLRKRKQTETKSSSSGRKKTLSTLP